MLYSYARGVYNVDTHEIMRPYGCITSIRFIGYDLSPSRAPLRYDIYFLSTSFTSYSFGQFFPVR